MFANATPDEPVTIYYSFHKKDLLWLEKLDTHLDGLRRLGYIATWHSGFLTAGTHIYSEIASHWERANVILLLISPDYLADEKCHEQMIQAIERAKKGLVHLIPILLRPADLQSTPLHQFTALPRNGRPIALWRQKDQAFADVVAGIRQKYTLDNFLQVMKPPDPGGITKI
jgi:hypothetical protein